MLKSEDIVFVDLSNLLYRAHYSHAALSNSSGACVSVLFGVPSMILALLDVAAKASIVFCFDQGYPGGKIERSFRYHILPEYKGNRKKDAPGREEALAQLPELYRFLNICKFASVAVPSLEADDLIGIGSRWLQRKTSGRIYIHSTDKDLYQLLGKRCHILRPKKGSLEIFTADDLYEETGVRASEWSRYKTLAGDPSDNIKAIKGVGPVGALRMLQTGVDPSKPDFRLLPSAVRSAYPSLRARWTHVHRCFRAVYIPRTVNYSPFSGETRETIRKELSRMLRRSRRVMKKGERVKREQALLKWFGEIESGFLTARLKQFFRGVSI